MSQDKSAKISTTIMKEDKLDFSDLPLELFHEVFFHLDAHPLASAKNVSQFWHQEAKSVARRQCQQLIPEHLLNQVSDPIRVIQRLKQLLDLRFLIFYPGNVHFSRNVLRDIRQSGLLHHALFYPYMDESQNEAAKKVFQEKLLSREILMRIKNIPAIEYMLELSKVRFDGVIYEAISYKTNDARIVRRALGLGKPEEIVRRVEQKNYENSLINAEDFPPQYREGLLPQNPNIAHTGYEKLENAALHACDSEVFDAIMTAFPWDSLQLINTLLTKCVTQCYVQSLLVADGVFPGWREFNQDIIDEARLLEKLAEPSLDKYFLMYAILFSGEVRLINKLFNFLISENELPFYPDFFLGALLVFLIKHHRVNDVRRLQQAISVNIDVEAEGVIIDVLENPAYLPLAEPAPLPLLDQQPREVGVDIWSGIIKQFSPAIFRTILLHKCDMFHFLLVDIMNFDNSQLVNYFMQSVVIQRLPVCLTLAGCKLDGANIPEDIDENTTIPYRALQHIAAWSGYLPVIQVLYSRDLKFPQPELFDLDVVISGGCFRAVDHLLAINSLLKLEKIHLDIAAAYGHIAMFKHLIKLDPYLQPDEVTCKFVMINLQVPMMEYLLKNYPDLTPEKIIFTPTEKDDGSDDEEEELIVADAQENLSMNTDKELDTLRRICHLGKLDRLTVFKHTSFFTRDEMRVLIEDFQQRNPTPGMTMHILV